MSAQSAAPVQSAGKEHRNGKPAGEFSDDQSSSEVGSDAESNASGTQEGDEEEENVESRILSTYRTLGSRRVDLVGDYAGDELFLIEGDSMLRRCFDDDKLDFSKGLQLLHAVYNVEHFLHQLLKRKCNFNIVFFDSNRDFCVPPSITKENACRFLLARAAIIRHIQTNVSRAHPNLTARVFRSWTSPDFVEYLQTTSPYFLMAHDGAESVDRTAEPQGLGPHGGAKVVLRDMILSFIGRGYNVGLVNGLEWRDTKVMTMVLESHRRKDTVTASLQPPNTLPPTLDVSEEASQITSFELTERQLLAVLTVSKLSASSADVARLCAVFLLHEAWLAHTALAARRVEVGHISEASQIFIDALSATAESILNSMTWQSVAERVVVKDVMDFIDGRLFLHLAEGKLAVTPEVKATFDMLINAVQTLSAKAALPAQELSEVSGPQIDGPPAGQGSRVRVLPFTNQVFDRHLESVRIKIDAGPEGPRTLAARKIFAEVTHWHNAKKPIIVKNTTPLTPQEIRKKKREDKRNQLFMAEMRTYAASLTNAVGRSLEPETIIVGAAKQPFQVKSGAPSGTQSPADSDLSDTASSTQSKGKPGGKKGGGGGKNAAKNAGKQAMLQSIAAAKAKKDEGTGDKIHSAWQAVCKGFEADRDPRSRYRKAKEYFANIQSSWREVVGTECELYLLDCLLDFWIDAHRNNEQNSRQQVAALIWSHARSIAQQGPLTKSIFKCLEQIEAALKLPPLPPYTAATSDRKLAFTFALPAPKTDSLAVKLPSKQFQLLECGPYLERSFDSKPDSRVDFKPDGWQRKVLDTIDAEKSAFVVAPTSAGKTFISFYAMRKVLEADDDGVLVYVAPTKALVNQIAAEVQARYSKKFKYGGKSVWGIHTRDYRINNPTGCQVLVTVPHVLQIMLLAPSHANSWSSRIKRIIFDEIHSIGQAEDGVVWEQLLLMAPCPIIALSATVGNPTEFSEWLATTQEAIGKELVTVQHPHRYSDLRKYFYVPPQKFGFHGLPDRKAFGSLGLENLTGFNFVHPVAGLVDKSRGIPEDLALEPRDCYTLWQAMVKVQTKTHIVSEELNPSKTLPDVVKKVDILKWEQGLKAVLRAWLADTSSPYDKLVRELEQEFRKHEPEAIYTTVDGGKGKRLSVDSENAVIESTLPLLCRLHEQDALPAIFFNYDRFACEKICRAVTEQLQRAELEQVKSGPKWAKTLERFEEYKKLKLKTAKTAKSAKKAKGGGDPDEERVSKLDAERDAGSADGSTRWESFDPDAPQEGYHFADHTKVQTSELEIYVRQLRKREVAEWLIDALWRGIGVHHAGMNRKYRQVVEILFRKGFLRVIIATGTLALGINMPCKTVVFSGDSVFLTALNYRQCAGRAGRRGFDLLGNVVFQGVSRQKVCRLISSRLPSLNGHFPLTSTLVLRLFTLLHESKGSKYAVNAINALLSQPRLYMGGASFKDQTMHHLRFSIEYLRRQQLLGSDGAPLNFTGLVSHLYFTENSSFAFHALLKEGYFHELCSNINTNEKDTLETLMMVLSHLFSRIECRQADEEYRQTVKSSSSIVFLPPMPEKASEILIDHNKQTLGIYRAYVETFVEQHIKTPDDTLPLSKIKAGAGHSSSSPGSLPASRIRSSFVALSGAGDDFDSIHDLCQTVREGVFLEEAVIPHMNVYPEEMEVPLNAYLLDFFKHGDVYTIERANRIRRSEIWFLLNDFSLVLATIITSLMNFMKLTEATDLDMLEVMGNMDAHEEAEDDKVAASEDTQSEQSGPSVADSGVVLSERPKASAAPTKKQSKNADSWEDLAGSESDEDDVEAARREALGEEAKAIADELAAWDGEGNEGLKDVLKAFQKLHAEFTVKFRAMWA